MSASSHDAIRQYSTSATLSVLRYRVAQVCALCSPPQVPGVPSLGVAGQFTKPDITQNASYLPHVPEFASLCERR